MPVPIIMSGPTESVGQTVIDNLKPEYEVVHFTLSASLEQELPDLLKGQQPSSSSSGIGSGVWAEAPKAIVFGGKFDDADVERLKTIRAAAPDGAAKIAWLRVDGSKPSEDYGSGRIKEALNKLKAEGKLDGNVAEPGMIWV